MLLGRRPRPCPFVDLGSLRPPAEGVRWDTELLPNPGAHPAPATGLIPSIEHKTDGTLAKLIRVSVL